MSVQIKGCLDARVAEHFGDDFHVHADRERERRGGMPKIMEAQRGQSLYRLSRSFAATIAA